MWGSRAGLVAMLAACGGGGRGTDATVGGDRPIGQPPTLSDGYPGDVGLGNDPAVVWFEDFEEGSVGAIVARYDQAQGQPRMAVVSDHAGGASALALTAGGAVRWERLRRGRLVTVEGEEPDLDWGVA